MSSEVQAKCTNSSRDCQAACAPELLLDQVLDRLDVVIGLALERLDRRRVVRAEAIGHLLRQREVGGA